MPADFPQDLRNTVVFKVVGGNKTQATVTEYDWPVGHVMEMSRVGMEQCLTQMAAVFAKTWAAGSDAGRKNSWICRFQDLRSTNRQRTDSARGESGD